MNHDNVAKVHLVGAGPGDPELLTIKAHALIRSADLILHDDLVTPEILALAGPQVLVVNVGKRCGVMKITQAEINRLMVSSGRRGLKVVRLKSGDPGVFGRLAEELDALDSAGIAYEIVPGVTAAAAAAASLGVSLTDRRKSSQVVFVSGHHAGKNERREPPDWRALAEEHGTLVVYMPGRNISAIAREILDAGVSPETPAAFVSRVGRPDQHAWFATIAELHNSPQLEPPTILLLGPVLERVANNASTRSQELDSILQSPAIERSISL
jgi:uroporphyrin-III C-methyltransferase